MTLVKLTRLESLDSQGFDIHFELMVVMLVQGEVCLNMSTGRIRADVTEQSSDSNSDRREIAISRRVVQ